MNMGQRCERQGENRGPRRYATEPDEYAAIQVYAVDDGLLEEVREVESGFGLTLRLVQLLPDSFIAASNARNGRSSDHGSMAANILACVAREP
jgi:hypothetical protein